MLPRIAKVPGDLMPSVTSLVEAASIVRGVLTAVLQEQVKRNPEADLPTIVAGNREELKLADGVIASWRAHLDLGQPNENGLNGGR
jgi:hypothetical protein